MRFRTCIIVASIAVSLLTACSQGQPPSAEVVHLIPRDSAPAKSPGNREVVNLRFVNGRLSNVDYLWLGYDGALHAYGTLAPGGSVEQSTYLGHVWIFQEGSIQLGAAVATNPGKTVEIK